MKKKYMKYTEEVYYYFHNQYGYLLIYGIGQMKESHNNDKPWESYRNSLKTVKFEYGVTSISAWLFGKDAGLYVIENVFIGNTMKTIYQYAFYNCQSLKSVTIPESVTLIKFEAFLNCIKMGSLFIVSKTLTIQSNAFEGCDALSIIIYFNSNPPTCQTYNYSCDGKHFCKINCDTLPNVIVPSGYSSNKFCNLGVSKTLQIL